MKHLLTFIGDNDCRLPEKGAIISLLEAEYFDRISVFYNSNKYLENLNDIKKFINNKFTSLLINTVLVSVDNPTDYSTVYPAMVAAVSILQKEYSEDEFVVSVTSGTPTMHACWLFLVKGGVITNRDYAGKIHPVRLLQISRDKQVRDINLELDDFPKIRKIDSIKAQNAWLNRENRLMRKTLMSDTSISKFVTSLSDDRIIGESESIKEVKSQIARLASTDISIFISGDTGTGKELTAQTLHYNSLRKNKPFIAVNCGAIPEHLFESEFFGHKKGAFTGAIADHKGRFSEADGGTLFLDEVVELPPHMQVKLLRVLQEGSFEALGDTKTQTVDVRIFTAANEQLQKAVLTGRFRKDLFYRLVQFELKMPSLHERKNDALLIARHLINQLNIKHGKNIKLDSHSEQFILNAEWQGNIRQLISTVQVAWQLAHDVISPDDIIIIDIADKNSDYPFPANGISLKETVIPAYYQMAMEKAKGNAEVAAQLLGINGPAFRAQWRQMERDKNK